MIYYTDYLFFALLGVMVIGFIAQASVQSAFNKYSKVQARSGKPAHQVASELLGKYAGDVSLQPVGGRLTDHYNPRTDTVGLSQSVYNGTSVAALAVAAHEIGHVMQYKEGYVPIRIRNTILPVASFGSSIAPWLVFIGFFMGVIDLMWVGIILYSAVLLFQLVTLPVEFNASARAIAMLSQSGYIDYYEEEGARKVLKAAATTYVVAALASAITLLRFFVIMNSRRRN
ncbi:MAG TPA: zinc metallopeptidase [Clostridiales bacterium]|jgi:Zn-dependent membrane protease YugP|nr:zinc metallopeptidase [Clostridiales bacterium]